MTTRRHATTEYKNRLACAVEERNTRLLNPKLSPVSDAASNRMDASLPETAEGELCNSDKSTYHMHVFHKRGKHTTHRTASTGVNMMRRRTAGNRMAPSVRTNVATARLRRVVSSVRIAAHVSANSRINPTHARVVAATSIV